MGRIVALVKANWARALAEVSASIAGTLGVVFVIAFIISRQRTDLDASASFAEYFRAGQISLPILSLSGIIFVALFRRQGAVSPIWAFILYVVFLGPIIATAFIIGLNPGFHPDVLSPSNVYLLWSFYCGLHGLWFLILVLEPGVPSPQEAAVEQQSRVNQIKSGAAGRA